MVNEQKNMSQVWNKFQYVQVFLSSNPKKVKSIIIEEQQVWNITHFIEDPGENNKKCWSHMINTWLILREKN